MTFTRILVLEPQAFQRVALVRMLRQLGGCEVLQAASAQEAITLLYQVEVTDIVLCDIGFLDFLCCVSELGLLHAVMLSGVVRPELQRTIGRMATLSGLKLLGVSGSHLQLHGLQKMLRRYGHVPAPEQAKALPGLPREEDVRRGLAQGEFRGWYQPQLAMSSGHVRGVEVLARWECPHRGLVLPQDFLGALLAYDLIDEMFKALLEQGLSLLWVLRDQGVCMELAFNLHASQLANHQLAEHIRDALQRYDLPGSVLMFELAENGLLELSPNTLKNLLRLRLLGCGLSLDDFALGFSSMKILSQLPFNRAKLDGSALNRDDPSCRALLAGTLALTRALGMSLVIKGISDASKRDLLNDVGGEIGQGFFLARPMTSSRLLQWIKHRSMGYDLSPI